jgi:hypothetical protein
VSRANDEAEVVFLLLNKDVDHGEKDAAEKMAGHLVKA